jgi:hypothetical protein
MSDADVFGTALLALRVTVALLTVLFEHVGVLVVH